MAIVMFMKWAGITAEQYDQIREAVNFEEEVPNGAQFHVASFDATGARICDVWDSAEQFDAFVNNRLMPAVQQVGVAGEPQVEILEAHNIFAPAFEGV